MKDDRKIALVTGANRGLGWATAQGLARKGYEVILTSRKLEQAAARVNELKKENLAATAMELDVSKPDSIDRLWTRVEKEIGRVDVLVNNAGILNSGGYSPTPSNDSRVEGTSGAELMATLQTNAIGAYLLCQTIVPGMIARGHGRVVNVSSRMGQLNSMTSDYPAYRISKATLNAVTRVFSSFAEGKDVLINSVCPGWVKTDMGGPSAHRTIEQGVDTILWASLLPKGGPTGGFFADRAPVAW